MILYTSYHLAEKNGADQDCPGYRNLKESIGGSPTEPIALSTVLDYAGLQDALWCLRAVHDEQICVSRKAARLWVLEATRTVLGFHNYETLRYGYRVASDILNGIADPDEVSKTRGELWDSIHHYTGHSRWDAYLVYMGLTDRPERMGPSMLEAFTRAVEPELDSVNQDRSHDDLVRSFLRHTSRNEGHCAGPGAYDPDCQVSPVIARHEKRIGEIVRKKRPYRFVTRKPRGYDDGIGIG
jgi:hypothetical protein